MVSITVHRGTPSHPQSHILSLSITRSTIHSSNSYTSLEHLVPKTTTPNRNRRYASSTSASSIRSEPRNRNRNQNQQDLRRQRGQGRKMASSKKENMPFEQKVSYGIGGAGNIRKPSEVIHDARKSSDAGRRRSSVWSNISASPGTSPDGKRNTLFHLFGRKNSVTDEADAHETVE